MFDQFVKFWRDTEIALPGFRYFTVVFLVLIALGYGVLKFLDRDLWWTVIPGFFLILLFVLFVWLILTITNPPQGDDATIAWMRRFLSRFVLFLFVGFTMSAIALSVTLAVWQIPQQVCRELGCKLPPTRPDDASIKLAHAILRNPLSRDYDRRDMTLFEDTDKMDAFLGKYGCPYCQLDDYGDSCVGLYNAKICAVNASAAQSASNHAIPRFHRRFLAGGGGCAATVLAHAGAPARILGVDLSHTDDDMDFKSLAARGVYFVYLKASQGTSFVDPAFIRRWKAAGDAGLIRGAYHTFTDENPTAQAAFFLSVVAHADQGRCDLAPALDLGIARNLAGSPGGTVATFGGRAAQWLAIVKGALGGRTPFAYVSAGTFEAAGAPPDLAHYPLWFGSYTVLGSPPPPPPWPSYVFRQFTDGHTGQVVEGLPYDVSEFNGPPAELFRLTH